MPTVKGEAIRSLTMDERRTVLGRGWRPCYLLRGLVLLVAACAPLPPGLVGEPLVGGPRYLLGPGDTVNVFVYRSPELSAEVPVRPDGRISTPLAPDVQALGKTPSELARAIENELQKYVKEPTVTVMVTGFVGSPDRQIRVIGEVGQPLVFPFKAELSLLDVLIASKGLTKFAAGNRAVIVRQEPDGPRSYNVRLDDLLKDGDITQNVPMQPGDTLFVPQSLF